MRNACAVSQALHSIHFIIIYAGFVLHFTGNILTSLDVFSSFLMKNDFDFWERANCCCLHTFFILILQAYALKSNTDTICIMHVHILYSVASVWDHDEKYYEEKKKLKVCNRTISSSRHMANGIVRQSQRMMIKGKRMLLHFVLLYYVFEAFGTFGRPRGSKR